MPQQKQFGSFYTPTDIAEFLVAYIARVLPQKCSYEILEPSVGGGVFLPPLFNSEFIKNGAMIKIDTVDLDEKAEEKSLSMLSPAQKKQTTFVKQNFLFFQKKCSKKYDLIIGNPPYVSKKSLSKDNRKLCEGIHSDHGLTPASSHNLWATFLISSTRLLNRNGILAFVLPAEFLQVKFAKEIRDYMEASFSRVEIISSSLRIFDDVEQDAVILIGYKASEKTGVFFLDLSEVSISAANASSFRKLDMEKSFLGKWHNHLLDDSEIDFLQHQKSTVKKIAEICTSSAGIVTAANKFFIADEATVEKYGLHSYCRKIIQKGAFVNGSPTFEKSDFENLKNQGKACFLLDFSIERKKGKGVLIDEYLALGEELKINERYKCLKRDIWYKVPSIWGSEGYFFKRSHEYPKLINNKARVLATDTAYRISMANGYGIESLSYSFYNSLTLVCSELFGRTYGGGVLELTPNEFRELPLPLISPSKEEYREFVSAFKAKQNIASFLKMHDEKIMREGMGLKPTEIHRLQQLRHRLSNRRIGKINRARA